VVALFVAIGVVHALLTPSEFTSDVRYMPELKGRSAGGASQLSSLAGLAGINLDNVTGGDAEAVRPDLYPSILQSTPFLIHLMKQPVTDPETGKPVSVGAYLQAKQAKTLMGRMGTVIGASGGEERLPNDKNLARAIHLSRAQELIVEELLGRVQSAFDKKTGLISISVKMPDRFVAASVAQLSTNYLTDYVTSYRTEKARQQAQFLGERVADAKRRYQSAGYALQNYKDRNRNSFLNVARLDADRLQSEFKLAESVYNELSRQLEQAKVKVQEETPIFKELTPPQIPNKRSEPKRTVMVLVYAFLGLVAGTGWVFLRKQK